jgi:pilus assembly protein Flp/PilA
MSVISRYLRAFAEDEGGATAIEYGLIASLIVIVIIAAIQMVGDATTTMYGVISAAVASVM